MNTKITNKYTNNYLEEYTSKALEALSTSLVKNEKKPQLNKINVTLDLNSVHYFDKDILDKICSNKKKQSYESFREDFIRNILNLYSIIFEKAPLNISSSYAFEFIFLKYMYESSNDIFKNLCTSLKKKNYDRYNQLINDKKILLNSFCIWFKKLFNYLVKNFHLLEKYKKKFVEIINEPIGRNKKNAEYLKILQLKLKKFLIQSKKSKFRLNFFDKDKKQKLDSIPYNLNNFEVTYYSYTEFETNKLSSKIKNILAQNNISVKKFKLNDFKDKLDDNTFKLLYDILPKNPPKYLPYYMFSELYYTFYCYSQMIYLTKVYSITNYNKISQYSNFTMLTKIVTTHKEVLKCSILKLKLKSLDLFTEKYNKSNNFLEELILKTWYFQYLIASYSTNLINIINGFNTFNLDIIITSELINKKKTKCVHLVGTKTIAIDDYLALTAYVLNNKIYIYKYPVYVQTPNTKYLIPDNLLLQIDKKPNSLKVSGYGNENSSTNNSTLNNSRKLKNKKKKILDSLNISNKESPRLSIGGTKSNLNIEINRIGNKVKFMKDCYVLKLNGIIFYYLIKSKDINNRWIFIRNCDKVILGILLPDNDYIIKKEIKYKMSIKGELVMTTAEILLFYLLCLCVIFDIPNNSTIIDNIENILNSESAFIGSNAECLKY